MHLLGTVPRGWAGDGRDVTGTGSNGMDRRLVDPLRLITSVVRPSKGSCGRIYAEWLPAHTQILA